MTDGVTADAAPTVRAVDLADEPEPRLTALRHWAASELRGLDENHMHAVQLVLTELVTNAYEHGNGAVAVRLRWTHQPCRIAIEVDDRSRRQPVMREADPDARDGRGLRMVDQLSHVWGTKARAGGKTVHAAVDCATYVWEPCARPDETARVPG